MIKYGWKYWRIYTADDEGRYVTIVVTGILEIDDPGTTMSLNSEVLDKALITQLFQNYSKNL